jgi:hypothetical protein
MDETVHALHELVALRGNAHDQPHMDGADDPPSLLAPRAHLRLRRGLEVVAGERQATHFERATNVPARQLPTAAAKTSFVVGRDGNWSGWTR